MARRPSYIIFLLALAGVYHLHLVNNLHQLTAYCVLSECNEDDVLSFDWNSLARKMCPGMVPDAKLTPLLFELARSELNSRANSNGTEENIVPTSCNSSRDTMSNVFYEFPWGVHGYRADIKNTKENGNWIAYLPVWKCANIEIRRYMTDILGGEIEKKMSHDWLGKKGVGSSSPLGAFTRRPICVVMAIRDPISHFLSGYNEVEYRIQLDKRNRERVANTWNFAKLPVGTNDRFEQFVVDLVSCPFEQNFRGIFHGWDKYPSALEFPHLYSMVGVLQMLSRGSGLNLTSDLHYLPTLTNLSSTWGTFVAESCPTGTFPPQVETDLLLKSVGSNHHKSSLDKIGCYKAATEVWNSRSRFSNALCAISMMDYACWRDLPDGVPTICMDLYEKYDNEGLFS